MKNIKIFLVPSSEAVTTDMNEVGDFFRQLNDMYFDSGIRFTIRNANEMDDDELRKDVSDSDLSFFLFFENISEESRKCFDIFFDSFKKKDKPKIVTYFKFIDSPNEMTGDVLSFAKMLGDELRHYYSNYSSIDTLKLGILMQIKVMRLDASRITVSDDGKLCLNGKEIADTKNIPIFAFNERLNELKTKEEELTKEWGRLRTLRMDDPNNEELYFEFSKVATERDDTRKALREFEDFLLNKSEELATQKGEVSPRQAEACRLLEMGDIDGACELLPLDEIFNDISRNERLADNAAARMEENVDELATRITALKMKGLNKDIVAEIRKIYEKIYDLCCTKHAGWSKLYDYAAFLENQNDYAKAIEVAEKLNWYYSDPSSKVDKNKLAELFILLGLLYKAQNNPHKAEVCLLAAKKEMERLVLKDTEAYESNLATVYNVIGGFYDEKGRLEEAEKYYLDAIEIRNRLVEKDVDAYEPNLATSYSNIGSFYDEQGRSEEAEKYLLVAIEIRERLVKKNADAHESDLAMSYNNAGVSYHKQGQLEKAEKYYLAAIEIYERLVKKNADAYEPNLAASYSNAGSFYNDYIDRECLEKPENGCFDRTIICEYFARKAKKYYFAAMEIYERLVKKNADAYEPGLANIYNNIGEFYIVQGCLGKSKKYLLNAIEIREHLIEKDAEAYELSLTESYFNYYLLKKDKTYLGKAYEIAKRRQDDPRCRKLIKEIELLLK